MNKQLNHTEKYNFSFTAGGLLYLEAVKVAELYKREPNWDVVRRKALETNLLQTRTFSTSERVCREICLRLELLSKDELEILINGTRQEQLNVLWIAICRKHRFVYDFAVGVIREKYLHLNIELRHEDYDAFFNAKADWHPELEELSDSTRGKIRQVVFKMLREAEVISKNNIINSDMLTPRLVKTIARHSMSDLSIFPASDAEIKALMK
jgi:hypothetical protein